MFRILLSFKTVSGRSIEDLRLFAEPSKAGVPFVPPDSSIWIEPFYVIDNINSQRSAAGLEL
jgi:hypothetical protein